MKLWLAAGLMLLSSPAFAQQPAANPLKLPPGK